MFLQNCVLLSTHMDLKKLCSQYKSQASCHILCTQLLYSKLLSSCSSECMQIADKFVSEIKQVILISEALTSNSTQTNSSKMHTLDL